MIRRMSQSDIKEGIKKINEVYDKIPETTGCMKYIEMPKEEGGCGGKCCLHQNPSVLYIEFMNTWKYVMNNFSMNEITDLIERALRNYLSDAPTKGCVFFDKEKRICTQHKTRPYNCRLYSQIPEEEFKPRYEALKVLQQKDMRTVVMPQCDLTETEGDKPTKEQSDAWWEELNQIEHECGIPKDDITDDQNGTYRTYHDHIILHIFPNWAIEDLTKMKLHGSFQEKELAILKTMSWLKKSMETKTEEVVEHRAKNKDKINSAAKAQEELEKELKRIRYENKQNKS